MLKSVKRQKQPAKRFAGKMNQAVGSGFLQRNRKSGA